MTETIMLSVIITLQLLNFLLKLIQSSEVRNLKKGVLLKKLVLADKILDSQLLNGPNMDELLTNKQNKEKLTKIEKIGYKK